RLCRALHPNAEGEPLVGADLRYGRGSSASAARLPRDLQRRLADRTARIHRPSSLPAETASTRGPGRVAFNLVSQQPRAVQGNRDQILHCLPTISAFTLFRCIARSGGLSDGCYRVSAERPSWTTPNGS